MVVKNENKKKIETSTLQNKKKMRKTPKPPHLAENWNSKDSNFTTNFRFVVI
jgi:hypothetical protein